MMSENNIGIENIGDWNSGRLNSGDRNTGDWNTGDRNTGNWNSGRLNSGDQNTGDRNTGNWNSGRLNSGDQNTGDRNTGDQNSGNWNSGDWNSGDWNSGDWNNGCFNTVSPKILLFNRPSEWTYLDWMNSDACIIMNSIPSDTVKYIIFLQMTKKEKDEHPEAETTGGYLKEIHITPQERQEWWDSLKSTEKACIFEIPNFDPDIFEEITMIHTHRDWEEYKNAETETD